MMRPFGKLIPGVFGDPGFSPLSPNDDGWTDFDTSGGATLNLGDEATVDTSSLTEPDNRRGIPQTGPTTPVTTVPVILPTVPASPTAFTIAINWDASVALAPSGFTSDILAVVNFLETRFTTPVTITINVGYEEIAGNSLGRGDLGESLSNMGAVGYADLVNAVAASATTATDTSVVASLPATNPVSGGNDWVTTAQAKALGLPASALRNADGGTVDGSIGFGAASQFTYGDTNDGGSVAPGTYDFFATALHELTEVMGRQLLTGTAQNGLPNSYTLLDLLHYSAAGKRDFTQFTPGYFSPDGGVTNLGAFNTIAGGDAGDWASSVSNDSFDAFGSSGVLETASGNDLSVMDAIGWKPAGSGASSVPVSPPVTPPVIPPVAPTAGPAFTLPFSPMISPFSPFQPFARTAQPLPASSLAPTRGNSVAGQSNNPAIAPGYLDPTVRGQFTAVAAAGGTGADPDGETLTGNLVPGIGGTPAPALANGEMEATTAGNPPVNAPVNVVVGHSGGGVIEVASLPGIVASAPAFIHVTNGNDTIDGTGMTGSLYFDGGPGGDTMTGGAGSNVYEYTDVRDSGGSAFDVTTSFHVGVDLIDFTGLGGSPVTVAALDPTATTIAAGMIGWLTAGGNTFVYANFGDMAEALAATNPTIELRGGVSLTSANFSVA